MEKLNKIKEFFKNNFKIIIPLSLILVIFIAFSIYYKISILDNYIEYKDIKVYQYFYSQKYDYTAKIGFNRKKEIVELSTKDYDIEYDSTPIYYQNQNIVILPSNMSIIMPTLNCSEYLSPKYSLITKKKNTYTLKTTKYENKLGHYFFYDGQNLYFFIDAVKLKINNQEINLSPMSYVYTNPHDKDITFYDKETDTTRIIEANNNTSTTVSNDYYTINISVDQIDFYGQNVLLTSKINKLNTIDKKEKS